MRPEQPTTKSDTMSSSSEDLEDQHTDPYFDAEENDESEDDDPDYEEGEDDEEDDEDGRDESDMMHDMFGGEDEFHGRSLFPYTQQLNAIVC